MGQFTVSVSPHLRDDTNIPKIMHSVNIALLPALIGAVYIFGFRALGLTILAVIAAMVTEGLLQKMMKRDISVLDGSAIITGILLAFNLPPGVPWWMPVIGAVFAIGVGKMPFGGLGYNPLNPALLGRAFLLASWPVHMTNDWLKPFWWKESGYNFFSWSVTQGGKLVDSISTATPLNIVKNAKDVIAHQELYTADKLNSASLSIDRMFDSTQELLTGTVGGCIGETSVLLLLIGAVFLMYKRYIDWRIPFTYIATVAVIGWLFGGKSGLFTGDILFQVFSGGLILGAFFMATDMVTTPLTKKGHVIFGIGCGILTGVIRLWGGYPEGVSYSILLMNLTTPLIDKYTMPKVFGMKKVKS
ncbi:RnfABCDGE type electron transport complex subunit D [bacterium]|nr:RnfABCDGE type electron transport complex subunit D [bacterium]